MRESNVVHIQAPVTVVGDIQGGASPCGLATSLENALEPRLSPLWLSSPRPPLLLSEPGSSARDDKCSSVLHEPTKERAGSGYEGGRRADEGYRACVRPSEEGGVQQDEEGGVYRKYSICERRDAASALARGDGERGSSRRRRRRRGTHLRGPGLRSRRRLHLLLLLLRAIALVLGRGVKHVEVLLAVRADLEDARHVAAPVAVVGRRPHGRQLVVVQDREAFHAQLVRA